MNEDILEKFKNADIMTQERIWAQLAEKLKLLEIKTFVRNPKNISPNIASNISMKRLIDIYNYAKSKDLKEIIINDAFYQKVFKKTKKDLFKDTESNSDFQKDVHHIIKTIYKTDELVEYEKEKLQFLNHYSEKFVFPSNIGFIDMVDEFFKIKDKKHLISKKVLDKFNFLNLGIFYMYYSYFEKEQDKKDNQNQEYISNEAEFINYLKTIPNFLSNFFKELDENKYYHYFDYFSNTFFAKSKLNPYKILLDVYLENFEISDNDLLLIKKRIQIRYVDDKITKYLPFINYKLEKMIKYKSSLISSLLSLIKKLDSQTFLILLIFDFLPLEIKFHYNFEYINSFKIDNLFKVNKNHIRKIFNLINENNYGDEIFYGLRISLNMYFTFGYNRSIDILTGKYGRVLKSNAYTFFENISKIEINNDEILDDKNNVKLKDGYLKILFDSEKDNNFKKILNDYSRFPLFYILYNNYEKILTKYGKINLRMCNDLLNEIDKVTVEPKNNKLLSPNILDNIIAGNRRNVDKTILFKNIEENYDKQQKRITSTIPNIYGECDGYTYQTMRLNDPIVYNLGYLTNCCFRITDIGEYDLKHATLDENARILLYYNESKELIAFSVLNRNGEVIIITSVEFNSSNKKIDEEKLLKTLMQAANDLYQTINQSPNDNIKLITIGANSKIKPKENLPFPSSKYPTPKCSKDDTYQANAYHMQQHLLISNLNYGTLRYDIKTPIYTDSRLKIEKLIVDNENISDCIKLIERINNKLMFENIININDIFIYNEDWYILLKEDGNIISNCLEIDPRAKEEFDSIKASISSKDSAKIYIKK